MSEFSKKFKQAFYVNFSRRRTDIDGVFEYRTYFGTALPTVRYASTMVNEKEAAANGVDTLDIVDQIKVEHYNLIMSHVDAELRKAIKLKLKGE